MEAVRRLLLLWVCAVGLTLDFLKPPGYYKPASPDFMPAVGSSDTNCDTEHRVPSPYFMPPVASSDTVIQSTGYLLVHVLCAFSLAPFFLCLFLSYLSISICLLVF